MMLSRLIAGSILVAISATLSLAQTADDYFHTASQQYVFGQNQASKQTIEEGLRRFPNDPKLSALKDKIKEPPKQDQQSQQQKDRQNQQQNRQQHPKPQPQKGEIGRDQADRILQALQNKEKEDLKKKQERTPQQEKSDKDW
jgi:hypothetical protein